MGVDALSSISRITGPDGRIADKGAEAAEEFEAYMVTMLARELRSSVESFSTGVMGTFGDLFDQEIGRRVAETGGFGLQDAIAGALEARGQPRPSLPSALPSPGDAPTLVEGLGRVTSRFGLRADPFTGQHREHHGLDIAAPSGSPIHAAAEGVVRYAGKRGGYGNVVILQHTDGTETRYAHCRDLNVKVGERVERGATVATVGSTGRSTGPHLHFEVRRDGEVVDPAEWLSREKTAQVIDTPTESAPER